MLQLPSSNVHRLTAAYFLLQAVAGMVWWIGMGISPVVAGWFEKPGDALPLRGLMLADCAFFVAGSFVAAGAVCRKVRWASWACWCVTGATLYAGLICLQGALQGTMQTVCFVMMIPACMLSLHTTMIVASDRGFPFKAFKGKAGGSAMVVSMLHTVVFYTVFFAVLPWFVLRAQSELGISRFEFSRAWLVVPALGFVAGGALAISSTALFAWRGGGTPLPTQAPPKLVVAGPYAFVRNPMAVGGIFQGIMVGLALGSWPVMLYSVIGAVIWHLWVRPVEEADLLQRFGEDYAGYRRRVTCWRPRWRSVFAEK